MNFLPKGDFVEKAGKSGKLGRNPNNGLDTIHDENIIGPHLLYVFRVADEYHQLFIDHDHDDKNYYIVESEIQAFHDRRKLIRE